MASKSFIKNVSPGLAEHATTEPTTGLAAGEYVEFELNEEGTIDDVYGQVSGGSEDHAQLLIKYPATNAEGIIKTISLTGSEDSFFLNSADGNPGTGKLWFRVPARAKLQLRAHPDNASNMTVNSLVALIRAGT